MRGAADLGQQMFVRDGVVEAVAPGLPLELIEICPTADSPLRPAQLHTRWAGFACCYRVRFKHYFPNAPRSRMTVVCGV